MQRCSAESTTTVVDPVVDDVGSAVLISAIDVVVSSGARVAVSEHDATTAPNITIATKPIDQSPRRVRPLRIRAKERIVPAPNRRRKHIRAHRSASSEQKFGATRVR